MSGQIIRITPRDIVTIDTMAKFLYENDCPVNTTPFTHPKTTDFIDLTFAITQLFHPTLHDIMLTKRPDPVLYYEITTYFSMFTVTMLGIVARAVELCAPVLSIPGERDLEGWLEARKGDTINYVSVQWFGRWIEKIRTGEETEFRVFEREEQVIWHDEENTEEGEFEDTGYETADEDDGEDESTDDFEGENDDEETEDELYQIEGCDSDELLGRINNLNDKIEEEPQENSVEYFQVNYEWVGEADMRAAVQDASRRQRLMA